MKKSIILAIAGIALVGAIVFTQIPYLKAKADTINYGNYSNSSLSINYKNMYNYMYNYMKNLNAKDIQSMMGNRITESQAQNMLNACTGALKSAVQHK